MRKMHMRRIRQLDYKLLGPSLATGNIVSEHTVSKHIGSKPKRRRRKKKR